MPKRFLFAACCLLIPVFCCAQNKGKEPPANVIIITVSGVRQGDTIADPTHQYIPNFWNRLRPQGTLYTNLVSINQEFHMTAVDAINTGLDYHVLLRIDTPSIFQYVRKKYALEATKLWSLKHFIYQGAFLAKAGIPQDSFPCEVSLKLGMSPQLEELLDEQERYFVRNFSSKEKEFASFGLDHWDAVDEVFYRFFRRIIGAFKPVLVHYVMAAVETGHYDTYSRYLLALKRTDEIIYEVWQAIEGDPFYKGRTYLFVCPDHGRNSYFRHHDENAYDNPSRVWLYVYGPDIRRGAVIERPIHHKDIFATVSRIMQVDTHETDAEALEDCFLQGQSSARLDFSQE